MERVLWKFKDVNFFNVFISSDGTILPPFVVYKAEHCEDVVRVAYNMNLRIWVVSYFRALVRKSFFLS